MLAVDHKQIIDQHVRSVLHESFGPAAATMIFATASNRAGVPIMGITKDQFEALVDAIVADQRVLDAWGSTGCADRRREWRALAG